MSVLIPSTIDRETADAISEAIESTLEENGALCGDDLRNMSALTVMAFHVAKLVLDFAREDSSDKAIDRAMAAWNEFQDIVKYSMSLFGTEKETKQ